MRACRTSELPDFVSIQQLLKSLQHGRCWSSKFDQNLLGDNGLSRYLIRRFLPKQRQTEKEGSKREPDTISKLYQEVLSSSLDILSLLESRTNLRRPTSPITAQYCEARHRCSGGDCDPSDGDSLRKVVSIRLHFPEFDLRSINSSTVGMKVSWRHSDSHLGRAAGPRLHPQFTGRDKENLQGAYSRENQHGKRPRDSGEFAQHLDAAEPGIRQR